MSYRLRISTAVLLFLTFPLSVLPRSGNEGPAESDLQRSLDKLFSQKFAKRSSTAVKIISAETGSVLYERNSRALLTPASTIKLISSAAAFARLGREYVFRTVVATDDTSGGLTTIRGNLYLQGFGDPYLTTDDLKKLAHSLHSIGVREIQGDIVGDESFFDHSSTCNGMPKQHFTLSRLPHLSSLTIDSNTLRVTLVPSRKKGAKVQVEFPSGGSSFKVVNQCVTVNERVRYRPTVRATWREDGCTIQIVGKMPLGSRPRTYTIAVKSPAWYATAAFRDQLIAEGIAVSGNVRLGTTPAEVRKLAQHQDPIEAVLTSVNKESDNFGAEMVLRTIGGEFFGAPGTIEKGVAAVEEFLEYASIPKKGHRIYDGSGLSHQNGVSADAFATLLRYMYARKDLFESFYRTLPAAGVDGTLKGRMVGTDAEGNLHAKTGTLNGVTSLAGYVTTADNEMLIFSITSTDFAAGKKRYKSLQDRIGVILARFSRSGYSSN